VYVCVCVCARAREREGVRYKGMHEKRTKRATRESKVRKRPSTHACTLRATPDTDTDTDIDGDTDTSPCTRISTRIIHHT